MTFFYIWLHKVITHFSKFKASLHTYYKYKAFHEQNEFSKTNFGIHGLVRLQYK